MTNLIEEFKQVSNNFLDTEKNYCEFVKNKLIDIFKPLLKNHPQIKNISWNQGFSVYNDNTYDYHELGGHISITWNKDKATAEYFKLLDIAKLETSDYFIDDDYGDNIETDEILLQMNIKAEIDEIIEILQIIPGNILVKLFGTNVTVIVSKKGITTDHFFGDE